MVEEEDHCDAWVGLDPPESFDCYLPKNHDGLHKGVCLGYIRIDGEYKLTRVFVEWESEEWVRPT